jgi:hypothetical protein
MKALSLAIILLTSCGLPTWAFAAQGNRTPSGRFQLIQLSDMRRDQFLLDSQTGKVWQRVCMSEGPTANDCGTDAWTPMDVEGITINHNALYKKAQQNQQYIDMMNKAHQEQASKAQPEQAQN